MSKGGYGLGDKILCLILAVSIFVFLYRGHFT